MDNHRTLITIAALCATALALLIWGVSRAGAGAYRAAQCHSGVGAGHPDAAFERSSDHYRSSARCGQHDGGLAVIHRAERTAGGRWGAWALRAPLGAEIVRVSARARGRARDGHVPELLVGPRPAAVTRFAAPRNSFQPFSWTGTAARLVLARLRCSRPRSCGPGEGADLRMRRLILSLRDAAPPVVGLGGPLLAEGARRGTQALAAVAADNGAGVRRIVAEVNGEPVGVRALDCAIAEGLALRLQPCPASADARFDAVTGSAPFRQGPNVLRVCALDYAAGTDGNRDCETRRVRVDNLCPLSAVPGGVRLRAGLRGGGRNATVSRGEHVTLAGRLVNESGAPISGARVCIASRDALPGAAERVLRTPDTGVDGRFSVRLPAGPNRELRVAHWPTAAAALEHFLDLRVRARPRLRVGPDRPLRNGERARFRVRLPGPRADRRRVVLQASANGRWTSIREGRTDARGLWRTSYRFRATTGERRYRFRALVPRQRGYPYAAGHSEVRRQTVIG